LANNKVTRFVLEFNPSNIVLFFPLFKAQLKVEQDKTQESTEAKPEDQANQQPSQEMYVTVQVPSQTINETSFTLQPVMVHSHGNNNTDQGLITTQVIFCTSFFS